MLNKLNNNNPPINATSYSINKEISLGGYLLKEMLYHTWINKFTYRSFTFTGYNFICGPTSNTLKATNFN